MNLGFVIISVSNLDKEKAFYTDVLGMTVVDAISGPTFIALRSEGGSLMALQDKTAGRLPMKEVQPASVELSFEVDDVDTTWKHWKEKGVEIVTDPIDLPFGRYFLAKDPEDYYLSVYRLKR